MKLCRLHLIAYGHFTARSIDLGETGLTLIHAPNEGGKSTIREAIADLYFGFGNATSRNFLHRNALLRIGGEFVDQDGNRHSLVRRKGRGETLMQADFTAADPMSDVPADEPVMRALTAGMNRASYESRFGLDRDGIIKGGRQLFTEHGDIGSALFAASTGSAGLSDTLKRFGDDARKLYLPSGNAKNARINRALQDWKTCKRDYDSAEVLPREWRRRSREHESALQALHALEQRRDALQDERSRLRELRAVLPILAAIDVEQRTLEASVDVPLLDANAATVRHTLEQSIATLRENIASTGADIARHERELEALGEDDAILAIALSVRKCVNLQDTLAGRQTILHALRNRLAAACERLRVATVAVDRSSSSEQLLERAPTPVETSAIGADLDQLERARRDVDAHTEAAREFATTTPETLDAPPAPSACDALRNALRAVERHASELQRLDGHALRERALSQELERALADAGIQDRETLHACRPLLDAQIDEAIAVLGKDSSARERNTKDRAALLASLQDERRSLENLLEGEPVATAEDVQRERKHRDESWHRLRKCWLDQTQDEPDRPALAAIVDESIGTADHTVDALARDTGRAARVQQTRRTIAQLEDEHATLDVAADKLIAASEERDRLFRSILIERNLPEVSPQVLRAWQKMLIDARTVSDRRHALDNEHESLVALRTGLAAALRQSIEATGLAVVPADAAFGTLVELAESSRRTIDQLEAAANRQQGQDVERTRARTTHRQRAEKLADMLASASEHVERHNERLSLPAVASIEAARARLNEFGELEAADAARRELERELATAEADWQSDIAMVDGVRRTLGANASEDRGAWLDRIEGRLQSAESDQRTRELAQQARILAEQRQTDAQRQLDEQLERLEQLRLLAGAASLADLPGRIESAEAKRNAQHALDKARRQLVEASPQHDEQTLRTQLDGRGAERLDEQVKRCSSDIDSIAQELGDARSAEEGARTVLVALDGSAAAAAAAEAMSQAASDIATSLPTWLRLKLAGSLISDAMARFRERAQAPMLEAASRHFAAMTGDEFRALGAEGQADKATLIAYRHDGSDVDIDGLSEGTRDQLYLSLRLAAIELEQRSGPRVPLVLDDVLMSSDEQRTGNALQALAQFARANPLILLTHHRHVIDLGLEHLENELLTVVSL